MKSRGSKAAVNEPHAKRDKSLLVFRLWRRLGRFEQDGGTVRIVYGQAGGGMKGYTQGYTQEEIYC